MMFAIVVHLLFGANSLDIDRFPITDPPPSIRRSFIMDGIPSHDYFILFGGYNSQQNIYNDIWTFNIITQTGTEIFASDGLNPGKQYLVSRYNGASYGNHKTDEYCIWGGNSERGQLNDLGCFHLRNYMGRKVTTTGDTTDPRYRNSFTSGNETDTLKFAIFGGITIARLSFNLFM